MARFEIGKTYRQASMGDSQLIYSFTVVARTDKMVTLRKDRPSHWAVCEDETMRRGVKTYEGNEICYPHGHYSMCVVLNAGRDAK